jgi:glucose-1-phosphate thymidylyltransferase
MHQAVLLAAGRGTRMQKEDPLARLSPEQEAVARTGVKALIPMGGRPFVDYVLAALADAGVDRVCLVTSPGTEPLAEHCRRLRTKRLHIEFTTQDPPRGTADAVLAARDFAGNDPFLLLNSDNYYPPEPLRELMDLETQGVLALERERFLSARHSNIDSARMAHYAIIEATSSGRLLRIVEKPDPETYRSLPEPVLVSVNAWRLGPPIFEACQAVAPSPRGELELPAAVQFVIDRQGETFQVVPTAAAVLDLSRRADVAPVSERLGRRPVQL